MDIIFDKFHQGYDDWYGEQIGECIDTIQTNGAFSLLEPQRGQKILDAGCGTGNYTFKLATLGCRVTGVDISRKMLDVARNKHLRFPGGSLVELYEMDCAALSFEESAFDGIISMAVFDFIKDPNPAFCELMRVLKPGGKLVIGIIAKGGPWETFYSSEACAGTAYALAAFKSKEDIIALAPNNVHGAVECLHIPPGLEKGTYVVENEKKYAAEGNLPGFACVSFLKK